MKKIKWTDEMIQFILELKDEMTYEELSEVFNGQFDLDTTANTIRKAYERYKLPIVDVKKPKDGPRILVLDIETAPIMAKVWSIWNINVALNQIDMDWHIMAFAAKWYDSDEIIYYDQRGEKDISNDRKILKKVWKLLDEADIVITHNGKSFDVPKLNARFMLMNIYDGKPPSTFRNIDTKRLATKHFKFTSNKLAFLTDKLCTKYKKLNHGKYPGNELWNECIKGNLDAWEEMREYNKYDVLSLEELYEKLVPWDDTINFSIYYEEATCSCGAKDSLKKNGFYHTNASKYQRYKCTECGKEYRDKKNLKKTDLRMTNRKG